MPKGPLSDRDLVVHAPRQDRRDDERHERHPAARIHTFGPAGMLEQEDGENWDQSTRGTVGTVARRYPLNYAMGIGRGEILEEELGPPRDRVTERQRARPALALPLLGGVDGGRQLGRPARRTTRCLTAVCKKALTGAARRPGI